MNGADDRRPRVTPEQAVRMLRDVYGIKGDAVLLAGERDATMAVSAADGTRYALKIAPAEVDSDDLHLEAAAIEHLAQCDTGLRLPCIVPATDGAAISTYETREGETYQVRLFTWVDGEVWARFRPHTSQLRRNLGGATARLSSALGTFEHPGAHRDLLWDLTRLDRVRQFTTTIADGSHRALAEDALDAAAALGSKLGELPHGVLYHDANDWNVLVGPGDTGDPEVVGFVDFGDLLAGPSVIDLAIAIAYGAMGTRAPIQSASEIVAGFHAQRALSGDELAVLLPLVQARLALSVTISAKRSQAGDTREYLTISEAPAWALLEKLASVPANLAEYTFRAVCGLEPCPVSPRVRRWLDENRDVARPVLDADLSREPVAVIDLAIDSPDFGTLADLDDLERTSRAIEDRIAAAGARVGVGQWDEVRAIYRADTFRDQGNERDEYRTVHVGVDLFVTPGTPVRAPLNGIVHGVRDNAGRYDYGPTIMLEHRVSDEEGEFTFHTLYGHLSRDSLGGLSVGAAVPAGTIIGRVGKSDVNGGWPPHLHLQLVCDLLGHDGEFPGVIGIHDRAVWLSVSPDPTRLVGIPPGGLPASERQESVLEARQSRIGPSLSVSYRRPLHIVRGFMQTLYDVDGQPYLDCVNNVAHVGHCHPDVVAATTAQKTVLETNSRYLHRHMVRLAERLSERLPRPLEVCYFVNSGSEANELALRLARTFTGRRGVVAVGVGYHGNTSALVDISAYKHDGPGGSGAPPWVRTIPLPDPYRGPYREPGTAGPKYAAHVDEAMAGLRENGLEAAALIAESISSCGGQIVSPDGFLDGAYAMARKAGAVCISDEVQTGLGRVGDAFWAFELQGVVPDIVTIGKPFGNGHPLAAVVTTREIADAFDNGMEYFNTFGGNTVSCAVGLAVLDVIESEGLQEHARVVGAGLLDRLRALQNRHEIIGDVRGRGLFLGFELVHDRKKRDPAPDAAARLVDRVREKGVLLSTDGPDHNVIKIKPPLCFSPADADHLASVVDGVLSEDYFRLQVGQGTARQPLT